MSSFQRAEAADRRRLARRAVDAHNHDPAAHIHDGVGEPLPIGQVVLVVQEILELLQWIKRWATRIAKLIVGLAGVAAAIAAWRIAFS